LVNSEQKFFVLVAFLARDAATGETGYKHQRIVRDSFSNLSLPVFSRPQIGRIAPDWKSSKFERSLQHVDLA